MRKYKQSVNNPPKPLLTEQILSNEQVRDAVFSVLKKAYLDCVKQYAGINPSISDRRGQFITNIRREIIHNGALTKNRWEDKPYRARSNCSYNHRGVKETLLNVDFWDDVGIVKTNTLFDRQFKITIGSIMGQVIAEADEELDRTERSLTTLDNILFSTKLALDRATGLAKEAMRQAKETQEQIEKL